MLRSRFLIPSVLGLAAMSYCAMSYAATVSSLWQYGQPVVITGEKLQGDDPDLKKLCIASQVSSSDKTCYYDFQLKSLTWTDSKISFLPPEESPVSGTVVLQLRVGTEKCFGSAGCSTYNEDTEMDVGTFTIAPSITGVNKFTTGTSTVPASSIEALGVYQIQGRFFGEEKGTIYLRQPRGSKEVPLDKIISWSKTSIVFNAPADIDTANGVSVNNHATAQWFDFPVNTSASSSTISKAKPIDKSQYSKEVQDEFDAIDKSSAVKMFKVLKDAQATISRYASDIKNVGSASDPICKSLNAKENTNDCQTLCKARTENMCRDVCADFPNDPECSNTCHTYKNTTDIEKSCVSSCLTECVAGTQCVCQGGQVNKSAYRDYAMAKSSLNTGYNMVNGQSDTDPDLVKALQQELTSAGLQLVKSGNDVSLVAANKTSTKVSGGLFNDVAGTHPYASAIQWAKESGVLQGYPDGTFKPDNTVNRAEFLKIVLGAKGVSVTGDTGKSGFRDVDDNAWYAAYVRYAKANGIIQGYPDGSFRPEQPVNFAEALKMAYNALGISTNDVGGQWYARFLEHSKANGVLYTNDSSVDSGMSRKDVVWIVWKLMTHSGDWQQAHATSESSHSTEMTASTNNLDIQSIRLSYYWTNWDADSDNDGFQVSAFWKDSVGTQVYPKAKDFFVTVNVYDAESDYDKYGDFDTHKIGSPTTFTFQGKDVLASQILGDPYVQVPKEKLPNASDGEYVIEATFTSKTYGTFSGKTDVPDWRNK